MTVLSIILSFVLVQIAFLHVAWAIGLTWPMESEAKLARSVVGTRDIIVMPGAIPCSLVAVALFAAAAWPFFADTFIRTLGLSAIAAVFLGRGLATFAGLISQFAPEEPFRSLDRTYYGPLCLALGLGYAILALEAIL